MPLCALSWADVRLAIGTAQFGLGYGVANTRGRVPAEEVAAILHDARAAGCDTIDTAIGYGDAETVLGDAGVSHFRIVSKLPAVPDDERDVAGWVRRSIEGSLARLRVSRLHGVLLHRPQQLLSARGQALAAALEQLKVAGLTTRVGVSAGSAVELGDYAATLAIDLVQVPFNLFDRRLLAGGRLERLVTAGVEVHVRSVFLQGLLVMSPAQRPPAFDRWEAYLQQYDAWLQQSGVSAVAACLRDALAQSGIARVVVGVDGAMHWRDILAAADGSAPTRLPSFDHPDPDLINPLVWLTFPAETMTPRKVPA